MTSGPKSAPAHRSPHERNKPLRMHSARARRLGHRTPARFHPNVWPSADTHFAGSPSAGNAELARASRRRESCTSRRNLLCQVWNETFPRSRHLARNPRPRDRGRHRSSALENPVHRYAAHRWFPDQPSNRSSVCTWDPSIPFLRIGLTRPLLVSMPQRANHRDTEKLNSSVSRANHNRLHSAEMWLAQSVCCQGNPLNQDLV